MLVQFLYLTLPTCRVDFYAHIVSYLPDEYPRFYAFQSTYAKHCRLPNGGWFLTAVSLFPFHPEHSPMIVCQGFVCVVFL